jgi:hypothetical protein
MSSSDKKRKHIIIEEEIHKNQKIPLKILFKET